MEIFETRESLGIASATTISASFSGPLRSQTEFVKVIIQLMHRFPSHFHLFVGTGEVRALRGLLHSEGVLPRMRFLGALPDITRLLGAIDLGLVAFPDSGSASIIDLMAAGKPVVALRDAAGSAANAAPDLLGEPELTAETPGQYVQIADRLIRDVATRVRLGERLRERLRSGS